jgi:hypothetical protein
MLWDKQPLPLGPVGMGGGGHTCHFLGNSAVAAMVSNAEWGRASSYPHQSLSRRASGGGGGGGGGGVGGGGRGQGLAFQLNKW